MPFSPEANISGPLQGYSDPNAVLYMLELRDLSDNSNKFVAAMNLPLVNSISFSRQEASSFDWTLGKEPIREFAGIRENMITISGRSGIAHRLGRDSGGNVLFASGDRLMEELQLFLEGYQEQALARQKSAHEAFNTKQLYLRCFFEGKHLRVEPVHFSFNRSAAGSRFSYEYQIQFRTYGPAVPPQFNFMGQMMDAAQSAADFVDQATAFVGFAAEVTENFGAAVLSFVEPIRLHAPLKFSQKRRYGP